MLDTSKLIWTVMTLQQDQEVRKKQTNGTVQKGSKGSKLGGGGGKRYFHYNGAPPSTRREYVKVISNLS